MKVFVCHASEDSGRVLPVVHELRRHFSENEVFSYEDGQRANQGFVATILAKATESDVFLCFLGRELKHWQKEEIQTALIADEENGKHFVTVLIRGQNKPPSDSMLLTRPFLPDRYSSQNDGFGFSECAVDILRILQRTIALPRPLTFRGLPVNPHLFSYEKDIIAFYERRSRSDPSDSQTSMEDVARLKEGCPPSWPQVVRWKGAHGLVEDKAEDKLGAFRPDQSRVLASALTLQPDANDGDRSARIDDPGLLFPEAGPRRQLKYPLRGELNVGIVVSGGIAPGVNAVIDGIVQRHYLYRELVKNPYTLNVTGFRNGFHAFDALMQSVIRLEPQTTRLHANDGGSRIGTSRLDDLLKADRREASLKRISHGLSAIPVDILYVIGGDGSMKAAHALWHDARSRGKELSVVAVPKTMDNDILWMWQSFGFLSAVQRAREIIDQLSTEVRSNPRICVLQLFGSDSGFVVSHSALASATGQCDLALIPEAPFSMLGVASCLSGEIRKRGDRIPNGLIVLAEAAIPVDALECIGKRVSDVEPELYAKVAEHLSKFLTKNQMDAIEDFERLRRSGRRIEGQTTDDLRQAGLKIVAESLPVLLPGIDPRSNDNTDWAKLRVFSNEPRHQLRAIPPSTHDVIMAQRLGMLAVDNAMAGYTDFMISQWLTEYVLVPLELVVLGRKRIPKKGIFWRSVLAKTGQPADLVAPYELHSEDGP